MTLHTGESVLTCKFCRHALWGKHRRSTGKPDYSKPGLCIAVTDKRVIVSATSSCEKWEKRDA